MIDKLPKIELHCHLDGSIRVDTIIDIAKKERKPYRQMVRICVILFSEVIEMKLTFDKCNVLEGLDLSSMKTDKFKTAVFKLSIAMPATVDEMDTALFALMVNVLKCGTEKYPEKDDKEHTNYTLVLNFKDGSKQIEYFVTGYYMFNGYIADEEFENRILSYFSK